MTTYYTRPVIALAAALVLSPCGRAAAQSADAGVFYSQGVRAYFAGQTSRAENYLSTALSIDSRDPRLYYFRALCLMRQGRSAEAQGDLTAGAALEAQQPNRFAVGTALERVQGPDRMTIEKFRRQGQLSESTRRVERDRARYEQLKEREADVLHLKAVVPLDQLLQTSGSRPVVIYERPQPAAAATVNPFATPTGAPQSTTAAAGDPFADDATKSAVPQTRSTNPAIPPATSGPKPATSAPASGLPADDENPFGPPTGAGSVPKTPPQTQPKTPPQTTPAEDDDPFKMR